MKCSHCGSTNTDSKIINKDKNSRNTLFFVIPFISTLSIFAILGIIADVFLLSVFVGFILAIVFGTIGKVVSKILPQKQNVVFVCNDCGKITKKF